MSAIAKDEILCLLLASELGLMIMVCYEIKKKGIGGMWW